MKIIQAANGGQDMEMCCTQFFGEKLVQAVKDGLVPEEKINQSALRIIRTLIAFEDAYDGKIDESVIGCKEHISLALESARKGITLLQNKNGVLPFNKEIVKHVVVLGKLAELEVIGDHGSSEVHPKYIVTPLQGIANIAPNTEVVFYCGEDLDHAKELAKNADAVVFVVGYNHDDEGEYISEDETSGYTGTVGGDRFKSL